MGNGKRKMEKGKLKTRYEKQEMANGKLKTGNGKLEMENKKWESGTGKWETKNLNRTLKFLCWLPQEIKCL